MAGIVILCEGETEELAIRYFVSRKWQDEGHSDIGLLRINLRGRIQDIGRKAALSLDDRNNLAVFTLIDLYGDRINHNPNDDLETKVKRARDWLSRQVNHSRANDFFPHLSVHETEAWILAEGVALAKRLHDAGIKADPAAERKNFQNPPSKRLNELFLRKRNGDRYHKILDGRPIFSTMEFDPVYASCQYFQPVLPSLLQ